MNRSSAITLALSAAIALAALTGCVAKASPASVAPTELRISAATSLKDALTEVQPAFEKANNVRLVYNFGASGVLQKQIEGGAPVDVFASASPKQIDELVAKGLVSAESTTTFAGNDLVIFVPKGNPAHITGPRDLASAQRLTTGNPASAPHGAKAQEWLTRLGMWDGLESKFAFAENAAQTYEYVSRGEVDAGIGFASEVDGKSDVEVVYTVPAGEITPIRYVAAPVAGSPQQALDSAFLTFLHSTEAQRVFAARGFKPAPGVR